MDEPVAHDPNVMELAAQAGIDFEDGAIIASAAGERIDLCREVVQVDLLGGLPIQRRRGPVLLRVLIAQACAHVPSEMYRQRFKDSLKDERLAAGHEGLFQLRRDGGEVWQVCHVMIRADR